jgi:hypothetical protein
MPASGWCKLAPSSPACRSCVRRSSEQPGLIALHFATASHYGLSRLQAQFQVAELAPQPAAQRATPRGPQHAPGPTALPPGYFHPDALQRDATDAAASSQFHGARHPLKQPRHRHRQRAGVATAARAWYLRRSVEVHAAAFCGAGAGTYCPPPPRDAAAADAAALFPRASDAASLPPPAPPSPQRSLQRPASSGALGAAAGAAPAAPAQGRSAHARKLSWASSVGPAGESSRSTAAQGQGWGFRPSSSRASVESGGAATERASGGRRPPDRRNSTDERLSLGCAPSLAPQRRVLQAAVGQVSAARFAHTASAPAPAAARHAPCAPSGRSWCHGRACHQPPDMTEPGGCRCSAGAAKARDLIKENEDAAVFLHVAVLTQVHFARRCRFDARDPPDATEDAAVCMNSISRHAHCARVYRGATADARDPPDATEDAAVFMNDISHSAWRQFTHHIAQEAAPGSAGSGSLATGGAAVDSTVAQDVRDPPRSARRWPLRSSVLCSCLQPALVPGSDTSVRGRELRALIDDHECCIATA